MQALLIAIPVIMGALLLVHVAHVERGTRTGETAPAPNQHSIVIVGWVVVVIICLISMGLASHPNTFGLFRSGWETVGAKYPAMPATNETEEDPGPSPENTTTTEVEPDPEAQRLLVKHKTSVTWTDDKITFPDVGDGWQWYVVDDPNTHPKGDKVIDLTYVTNDKTGEKVQIYLAKKEGDDWRVSRLVTITQVPAK